MLICIGNAHIISIDVPKNYIFDRVFFDLLFAYLSDPSTVSKQWLLFIDDVNVSTMARI